MMKVMITWNGRKIKIPLVKCPECEDKYSSCKECLKKSWEEACLNAGEAKLLGGEYIDD